MRRTRAGLLVSALLAAAGCSATVAPGDRPASPETSPREEASPREAPRDRAPERDVQPEPTDVAAQPRGEFRAQVSRITPALRARMSASHRPGCPVPLSGLRHLELSYAGFDGRTRTGELVVAARHAADVVDVFARLHEARFPIRRMQLVDAYGADDGRSMAANNTSAYNCRRVAGTERWSEHAYGGAIDLNPVQNPYVQGTTFVPAEGAAYVDVPRGRGARAEPGVVVAGDVVDRAFAGVGWDWGGRWRTSQDYQHFSASGG